jgi:hypothetical protein
MVAGSGVKYGKDSSEYEMAGAVRTSKIKRAKEGEAGFQVKGNVIKCHAAGLKCSLV